ncbi:MAG: hypothetical protein KAW12_25765 [Candidatus Aminicenantes bacterium]|nr:hypothetical protein [Candidatus Aminicenantes bacterium]
MKSETKKRVFARLLAQELELCRGISGGAAGPTWKDTTPPDGGSPDVTNLAGDNDGPLPK